MEAFEAIRNMAARLHADVVSAGADPLRPMVLAEAAIRQLELELLWLEPGNPALKGARALFDDQSGAVICENSGEPGERAQLVSHEIGHAHVHASSSFCTSADIDPSEQPKLHPLAFNVLKTMEPANAVNFRLTCLRESFCFHALLPGASIWMMGWV